jgi:predicted Rossmann fold nucleotide-binding protein DprA/Smf involved in DNA uptake
MPILNNPFNITFSRSDVPGSFKKEQMYELTNMGRKEVDNLEPDDTEFPIMAALHHKAMSIDDLDKETHLGAKQVHFALKKLMRQGKVKTIQGAGE